ncbi:MAG TPA: hypothetical protein VN609_05095 [Propionibacteriaceae bacterium]|nr:hypothetical protein [Propionibacteriaceae bacterium]
MDGLDHLLCAKRDQDADDDDSDLTGELAPAVQRFGKVEMHATSPRQGQGSIRKRVSNGCYGEIGKRG